MPRTLLLADDSVTIQKVVGISFASEDIDLVTVDNGDDAIARAREIRPDIVLADVVMPGMTGYEVCEAIKGDPQLRHIPVLLLTGTFEAFDEERARSAGADGHITKPFEAQSLVDTVNARLASAPPAPAPPEPARAAESTLDPITAPPVEAPEALTTLTPAPADAVEAAPSAHFDAPGADTQIPSEPMPAPVVDIHPAPSEEAEALTTALLVDDDDARTQVALAPEPAAETHVAFGSEPAGAGDDLFEAAAASSADDGLLAGTPPPADLFAETGASFAAVDDDPLGSSGGTDPMAPDSDPMADAFGGPMPMAAADAGDPHDAAIEGALLDPDPGRDYDVSASDLGTPLAPLHTADPVSAEPVNAEPLAETDEPLSAPEPLAGADDPLSAPEPLAGADDPLSAPEPIFSGDPALEDAAPASPEAAPVAAAGSDAPRPFDDAALRGQLHESLERIAWESFGDVTERIVSEAVERIEKVAWEVIPQMAEALIREEIRRMKGEE